MERNLKSLPIRRESTYLSIYLSISIYLCRKIEWKRYLICLLVVLFVQSNIIYLGREPMRRKKGCMKRWMHASSLEQSGVCFRKGLSFFWRKGLIWMLLTLLDFQAFWNGLSFPYEYWKMLRLGRGRCWGTDLFAYISANLYALQWRSYRYEAQPLSALWVP